MNTYVSTALDTLFSAAFKALLGTIGILEIFIVTAEPEPRSGIAATSRSFKVSKGDTRVDGDEFGIGTGSSKDGAPIYSLCGILRKRGLS